MDDAGTRRRRGRRIVCGALAVVVAAQAAADAELPDFMLKPSPQHVRVMCYNVLWDSIFEDGDPNNHIWREFDRSDQFVRMITALNPDIICLQEINSDRDPQDVGDILNAAIPLGGSQLWRMHKGSDNVIASRWDLTLLRTDTIPTTNRGQAMALVNLPDALFDRDLYLMNAHFKAGGTSTDINRRQTHADAIVNWMRDIRTPGGNITLSSRTAILVLGDLNVYDTDPHYHLTTLLTGDIVNQGTYGADSPPDWDGTTATDVLPLHNGVGPDIWTWRDDSGSFNPGAIDRVIYSDTVMSVGNSFVLNTTTMSPGDLAAAGLLASDVVIDAAIGHYDHVPLIVDFEIEANPPGDADGDGDVDLADFAAMVPCLSGPLEAAGFVPPSTACRSIFDDDADTDVDLRDWSAFQAAFSD